MKTEDMTPTQTANAVLDASRELADPIVSTVNVCGEAKTLTAPSLLERLEEMVFTGPVTRKAAMAGPNSSGSRPPLHIPSLELRDRIVDVANREAAALTGSSRYQANSANAVRAWAYAAHRHGGVEVTAPALKALRGFASAIRTLEEPPVFRDLAGTCGECQAGTHVTKTADGERRYSTALVVEVRDGEQSRVSCKSCRAVWTPSQTRAVAAYVTGVTEEELEEAVTREFAPVPIKRNPDAAAVLADLTAYAEEHGHLPPARSKDPVERRLAEWVTTRTRTNRVPSSEQGLITRAAVMRLLAKYPTASQAKLAATETSTAMTTEMIAA